MLSVTAQARVSGRKKRCQGPPVKCFTSAAYLYFNTLGSGPKLSRGRGYVTLPQLHHLHPLRRHSRSHTRTHKGVDRE